MVQPTLKRHAILHTMFSKEKFISMLYDVKIPKTILIEVRVEAKGISFSDIFKSFHDI
jgi:hypothetical protein